MHLIDTHCHLSSETLSADIWNVLKRARQAGVTRLVTIATSATDAFRTVALADQFDGVYAAIGVHPHEAGAVGEGDWDRLRELRHNAKVLAWGEIGLDYHYDFSARETQRQVFAHQLDLAGRAGLPVVIHCREALDDTIAILDEQDYRNRRVVFHCFSGTRDEAERIVDRGWWLSFTGIVTFRGSAELQDIVRAYPLEQLMLETDAPYLTPEPHRKIRPNEPQFLSVTAAYLAQLKGVSQDELAAVTTRNACRFFGLSAAV